MTDINHGVHWRHPSSAVSTEFPNSRVPECVPSFTTASARSCVMFVGKRWRENRFLKSQEKEASQEVSRSFQQLERLKEEAAYSCMEGRYALPSPGCCLIQGSVLFPKANLRLQGTLL